MSGEQLSEEEWQEAVSEQAYQEMLQETQGSIAKAIKAITEAQKAEDEKIDPVETVLLLLVSIPVAGVTALLIAGVARVLYLLGLWPSP